MQHCDPQCLPIEDQYWDGNLGVPPFTTKLYHHRQLFFKRVLDTLSRDDAMLMMPHLLHVVLLMPLSWETINPYYMLKALDISSSFLSQKQTLADCVVSVNPRRPLDKV